MKKMLLVSLVLILCSAAVLAADHKPLAAKTTASQHIRPATKTPGLQTIFSNLGPSTDAYDSSNGYYVMGENNAAFGYSQDIAIPFVPAQDSTITKVKLALQYADSGTNAAVVGIYSDASGLPGTAINVHLLKNFSEFGSGCCALATWRLGHPVSVSAGTQYWVVGTTNKNSSDSLNTWDFVYNDAPAAFAFQQEGGGWILITESEGLPPSAVAVYGTTP